MNGSATRGAVGRSGGVSPPFVVVCGPAGSGNTLMFGCLIRDPRVYGVNEDGSGTTLKNLAASERDFGGCPHAVEAFVGYLHALRGDRSTLVLKTPSNVRCMDLLRTHLPGVRFIGMVREPRAAIASGLARHQRSVADVAALWKRDMELLAAGRRDDTLVVAFDRLACAPEATLLQVSRHVLPLVPEVSAWAERSARPERAAAGRWLSRVSAADAASIEERVAALRLDRLHREVLGATAEAGDEAQAPARGGDAASPGSRWDRLRRLLTSG